MDFSHIDTVEDIVLGVITLIGAIITYVVRKKNRE